MRARVMRREHERIGAELAQLATIGDHLAYLIKAAEAYHREQAGQRASAAEPGVSDA